MGYHFIECDRDQRFLLPEDMRDWLPEDDVCWFLIDIVEKMDLYPFYLKYNPEGMGRRAYDPRMLLCLMIYAYALGERSSRRIEALCRRDVAFRVVTGNRTPDHTTICRFRKDNAEELERAFTEALELCVKEGAVDPGVLAVDGTRIEANASMDRNIEMDEQLKRTVRRWLEEADKTDEAEDELYGPENRENKVPERLADPETRKKVIEEYFAREREPQEAEKKQGEALARRRAEEKRTGKKNGGPRAKSPAEARARVESKKRQINTTDPDSRIMKDSRGYLQGYNTQVAVTKDQLIVAAELYRESSDAQLLHPLIEKAQGNLERSACQQGIEEIVADTGYMSEDNVIRENITAEGDVKEGGPRLYIATKKDRKIARELKEMPATDEALPPDEDGLTGMEKMALRHRSERGRELFRIRGTTVEPVFGQIKEGRKCRRFMLRGIDACKGELMLICTVHNLMKLFALTSAPPGGNQRQSNEKGKNGRT